MKIEINPLDANSIDKAIKDIANYKLWVEQKENELLKELADYGVARCKVHYSWFQYDGDYEPITVVPDVTTNTAKIIAKSKEIAFIEFGTGVYFNDAESYPLPRPNGIVGIGQYGKGRGNDPRGWYFTSSKGTRQYTKGNPPAKAMYKTSVELAEEIGNIAREVFKS